MTTGQAATANGARNGGAAYRVGVPCQVCPLRLKTAFKDKTAEDIDFIQSMKVDHRILPAGVDIIRPGQEDVELFTLFSGWAFRYKLLPDGRRQILNILLPGDLLGLQASLLSAAQHGIAALTPVELCVFSRKRTWDLFVRMPAMAYEIAWLGAREEGIVDENMASVGQRNAAERIAALLFSLYRRMDALGLTQERGCECPLSQQHIADAMGLSLVHTSKTLSRLRREGILDLSRGRLTLLDPRRTARMAAVFDTEYVPRPLI